jgi:uncharacterized protein YndB with AHSA1/START domain
MTVAPIRREILVAAPADRAFELFTGRIGDWWPLARFSVFGDGTVAFEGTGLGRSIVERSGDRVSVWAEVTEWDPPGALGFTWHPGTDPAKATQVRVTFTVEGEQTLVSVEHSGWAVLADPTLAAAAAQEYGQGWPGVLGGFAALVAAANEPSR